MRVVLQIYAYNIIIIYSDFYRDDDGVNKIIVAGPHAGLTKIWIQLGWV